ncbi:hypothetical protein ACFQJ7_01415 [Halovenus rubra]|uniref:Uncharacterized protein n=2 Tax=Halovenus rubra TaxID=869890 RepID=A0ABD5X0B7_9EURY|nr:hypothetical protein [Halovenus rubra]
MNYQQFGLWDVFGNIIPGTVVMFGTASLLSEEYFSILQGGLDAGGAFFAFLLVIFSFVVGWVFQALARVIDGAMPYTKTTISTFRDEVSNASSGDDGINYTERYMRGAKLFFADNQADELDNLDWELSQDLVFHMTYGHIYDNNIGRSHRFYVLMILSRSLYVAFGLTAVAHLVILLANSFIAYSPVLNPGESGAIIGITLLSSFLMFSTKDYMQRSRVKTMIGDFYRSELTD